MFSSEVISSFNELESALYRYIMENSEKVVYMRIRDLADAAHISTSSVLRFCRKVNCEGFSEFKVKLKMYLESEQTPSLKSSQHFLYEFIERTLKGDFEGKIKEAAKLIAEAKNVLFIGTGSSGILAQYGARYFSSLEKFSFYINDPFFPMNMQYLDNSVTIVLSVSGENSITIDHISKLKREGSKIISITNNQHCTISRISDLNIAYYVTDERVHRANITTQTPVVYILEAMARDMFAMLKEK